MNSNSENKVFIRFVAFIFALVTSVAMGGTPVFAGSPKIILFYTDWHAKSKEAKAACTRLAGESGIPIELLNIEQAGTQKIMGKNKIEPPASVPSVYILNRKGKVVYRKLYASGSQEEIKKTIQGLFR